MIQQIDIQEDIDVSDDDEEDGASPAPWNSQTPTPEDTAGFWSKTTFWWINSFMHKGYVTPITDDTVYAIAEQDKVKGVTARFEQSWEVELHKPKYAHVVVKMLLTLI